MPEDNKGFSNPFLNKQQENSKEQQPQGQPAYYPYPPMPQAQLDENGQPMPMYYPYPPVPQAQLDENGQPMPMYYPYPPVPQAQQTPQVSQNPPSVSFEPEPQPSEQAQDDVKIQPQKSTKAENEQPKDAQKDDELELDGHKVYVRQPVIDTTDLLKNNINEGEGVLPHDEMIIREPRVDDSIFSAPTPVYSPEDGAKPEDSAYVEKEEPKEEDGSDSVSFMDSMQSLYSAFGTSDVVAEKKESVNVSSESMPDFTETIDAVTNPAEDVKTVYSVPVQKTSSPVEVDPSMPEIIKPEQKPAETKIPETAEPEVKASQDDEEKDSQYWEFMNNLLSRFDDGEVHAEIGGNKEEQPTKPASNFLTTPKEAEPDRENLSNFGKNVDKKVADKAVVSKGKKSIKNNFEPESFEDGFGEFGGNQDLENTYEKAQKPKKVKKQKPPKVKKEKATKIKEEVSREDAKGFKKFLFTTFPVKGDTPKEIVRKVVVIVSFIVLIGCATYFTGNFIDKKQNEKEVSKLAQIMETGENSEQEWAKIEKKHPNVNFPSGMQTKFADLYAMNSDLVGWIKIDGLDIDLPVVQTKDNDYYLKHNFSKEKSHYGTVFANFNNNIDTLDLNTVLFGHRMHKDTQMFTNLREYAKPEGFLKAPIIEFNTLYANYQWKVYAVFITNGSSDGDNGYVFNYVFPNLLYVDRNQWEKTYGGYVNQINQRALYLTGVDIQPTDRILTLSTCTYEFDNARLVVVARMLREGESVEIDPDSVAINSNPRYPQAWYDKKGISNPYKGAEQWRPVV